MIYTSYYSKLKDIPSDVHPYAVSNSVPKGISIQKLYSFIPDWSEVALYKASGDWERFRTAYRAKLQKLKTMNLPDYDCVLLCYEKDSSVCHRSILAEWLRDTYHIDVKEWG